MRNVSDRPIRSDLRRGFPWSCPLNSARLHNMIARARHIHVTLSRLYIASANEHGTKIQFKYYGPIIYFNAKIKISVYRLCGRENANTTHFRLHARVNFLIRKYNLYFAIHVFSDRGKTMNSSMKIITWYTAVQKQYDAIQVTLRNQCHNNHGALAPGPLV